MSAYCSKHFRDKMLPKELFPYGMQNQVRQAGAQGREAEEDC